MRLPALQYAAAAVSWSPSPSPQQQRLDSGPPKTQRPSDVTSISSELDEVPGGSPLSLCEVSRSTDLFQITSVELSRQPLYFDENFLFNVYGTFQDTFLQNATIDLRVDCGSHCEEYGNPPGETPSETVTFDFCRLSDIQQPLGRKVDTACPPEKGWALVSSPGYVFEMFLGPPGATTAFAINFINTDADCTFPGDTITFTVASDSFIYIESAASSMIMDWEFNIDGCPSLTGVTCTETWTVGGSPTVITDNGRPSELIPLSLENEVLEPKPTVDCPTTSTTANTDGPEETGPKDVEEGEEGGGIEETGLR